MNTKLPIDTLRCSQIPFGVMAKKYGSLGFLGWGMLINSVFGFLVPISAHVSN